MAKCDSRNACNNCVNEDRQDVRWRPDLRPHQGSIGFTVLVIFSLEGFFQLDERRMHFREKCFCSSSLRAILIDFILKTTNKHLIGLYNTLMRWNFVSASNLRFTPNSLVSSRYIFFLRSPYVMNDVGHLCPTNTVLTGGFEEKERGRNF